MSERSQSFNGSEKHVQVIARPRPLSDNEKSQNLTSCLNVNETRREIIVNCKTSTTRFFNYDHVFGFQTRQQDVYKVVVAPIVDEVLKGYSSTIFAYGQTGSGKTHTMLGIFPIDKVSKDTVGAYMSMLESDAGIMPRAIHHIFQGLQRQYIDYTVKITFLELYNEELTDLLADPTNEQPEKIKIYEDKDKTNTIIGAIEAPCETPFDAFKILIKGAQRRQTAETLMNASSSRSHSIFTMTVTMKDAQGDVRLGKLHLVDLAGSENISRSGATDKRAREAGTINQSLLTLGRVITALISNEKHICYRDSKLTRILQDSLCGKTITSIIITLSPANEAETLSTLEYGHRARSLKIRPEINQLSSKDVAREYLDEIRRLRQELDAKREVDGIPYSQYITLKNQMTLVQTLSDNNQAKLNNNEQQIDQYRTEVDSLRQQLTTQQQDFRSEMNERKEMLALNRYRYDELVQITNKALTFREQVVNTMQQLSSTHSTSSTLIEHYIKDCQSIGDSLQINVQRMTEDIRTMFSTCNRSVGQALVISTNIGQQIHMLNENVRAVLSLAFQNFHTIFEELNNVLNHFQTELERELRTLIETLVVDIKNDADNKKQAKLIHIQEETLIKMKTCFQELLASFGPSSQSLWVDLHTFLTQRFNQMSLIQISEKSTNSDYELLDLNIVRTKCLNEHEKQVFTTQNKLEELIIHLIDSVTNIHKTSDHKNTKLKNANLIQHIHNICTQHGHEIRQLLEIKLQSIFNQVRDEYEQQCGHILTNIERDTNQLNLILQDIGNKFDSSPLITNDSMTNLIKQSQRIDVMTQNLEYDWKKIKQSVDKFECETILPLAPVPMPKPDAVLKLELAIKDQQQTRLIAIENKENINDGTLLPTPIPISTRPATINVIPCRPKNDTPFF
ncbi:unnamed protein product [Rotaria socialis]|uniref:Kinesin-like protein n=1 Tax=Rotaria socialis TaxID=392032 RepID=A0A820V4T4_9BILA|nr:unnamed protein product [Rotaria socialis]CAF4520070.1 unnamed protein product [Rotaria socialis]